MKKNVRVQRTKPINVKSVNFRAWVGYHLVFMRRSGKYFQGRGSKGYLCFPGERGPRPNSDNFTIYILKKIPGGGAVQIPPDPLLDSCMCVYEKQVKNVLGMNKAYPQDLPSYTLCLV